MRRILALLCLAATARGIAPPFRAPAPRIIDGADARFGEFPWYALFLGNLAGGNGILYCGAFLAGENVAITAAHCLGHDDTLIDTARLYFQSGSAPDGDQRFTSVFANVLYAAKHPSYTGSQDSSRLYWYDIAVLFLDSRIVGVPLPQINIDSATPKPNDFTVIGFGRTSTDGAPSRVLRQTDVVRYDSTLC
jgi:V8-like Glu-specific endopeptidase